MPIVFSVILLIVGCFSYVLLFGAPYLPTLSKQINTAFDLAALSPQSTILELGCGDGRVLIAAAKRGLKATGYEINPIMFMIAWLRTRRYNGNITVIFADFWRIRWPEADAIYVFLLPSLMDKLEKKIIAEPAVRPLVISFAFQFANKKPIAQQDGVFLYLLAAKSCHTQ